MLSKNLFVSIWLNPLKIIQSSIHSECDPSCRCRCGTWRCGLSRRTVAVWLWQGACGAIALWVCKRRRRRDGRRRRRGPLPGAAARAAAVSATAGGRRTRRDRDGQTAGCSGTNVTSKAQHAQSPIDGWDGARARAPRGTLAGIEFCQYTEIQITLHLVMDSARAGWRKRDSNVNIRPGFRHVFELWVNQCANLG